MLKKYETLLYSSGGVIALLLILLLVNFVLGAFNQRIDLTQGRLYTLSEGTRSVLSKLEAPVRIRLYFTQSADTPLGMKVFGRRVEDLLAAFRREANGKIIIEKLDPQPDSEAEDSASLDGIEPQATPAGDRFYLGLAISGLDRRQALPTLAPDRERLLEYDLTRAIARAYTTKKPVVGVMTPLPAFGMPANPMMGMQGQEPSVFINELRRDFSVKRVAMDAARIEDDIGVLLVMHPRGISDQAQYALDQFVMRGGKLIAFLDPHAYFDQMPGAMMQMQGGTSSTLEKLLKAWGIGFDATKVVMDMKYPTGAGPRLLPTLLSLAGPAFDRDDVTTSRVGLALVPFAGAFTGKPVEGLAQTVLIKTSTYSMLADAAGAVTQGEAALKGFTPSGIEYPIAIRLTGRFSTAFAQGRPVAPEKPGPKPKGRADKAAAAKAAESAKAEASLPAHLATSKDNGAVVLVGDSDFINDDAAVSIQELFGQRIVVPRNGNLAFAQALVEQFAGDSGLIGLRSRATATRPFTVIREMEARAQQSYLGKIKSLEESLSQVQEKLQVLQKTGASGASVILSPEQQAELENFRKKSAETRRELKQVRKELRADSEALQFTTKLINIAVMPLLVALTGLGLAIHRRRRKVSL
jgi:ABC-type uncharacterized transport system involved in gliding motility auxiliary subunit